MERENILRIRLDKTIEGSRPLVEKNCNLDCIWCHGDFFRHQVGKKALTNDELVSLLSKVIKASEFPSAEVKISGQGEPTLVGKEELLDLIRRLKQLPEVSKVKLITNGVLIGYVADLLVKEGLDTVTISLNSLNRKTYSLITGTDYLPKVIKGIKQAIKVGLKVKINSIYTKLNSNEIMDFIQFSSENGNIPIKFFDLLIVNNICKKLYLPLKHLIDMITPISQTPKYSDYPYPTLHFITKKLKVPLLVKVAGQINICPNKEICPYAFKCLEGCRSSIRISQDGYLHPCGVRTDNILKLHSEVDNREIQRSLRSGGKYPIVEKLVAKENKFETVISTV